jgi:hypothetical protein
MADKESVEAWRRANRPDAATVGSGATAVATQRPVGATAKGVRIKAPLGKVAGRERA